MRLSRQSQWPDGRRKRTFCWAILGLALGCGCWVGCSRQDAKPSAEATVAGTPAQAPDLQPPTGPMLAEPAPKIAAESGSQPSVGTTEAKPPESAAAPPPESKPDETAKPPAAPSEDPAARRVLEAMASAYGKATSYADAGRVHFYAEIDDNPIDETDDMSVTLVRPNKVRAHIYQGMLVCDGHQFWASVKSLPNQVLSKPAPAKLTLPRIYSDSVLTQAMTQGAAGAAPQLLLLLQSNPLDAFLEENSGVKLLAPEKIDDRVHDRVEIARPEGKVVLWIDQQTHVLRRIEMPTEGLRQVLSAQVKLGRTSLTVDLKGARLGGEVGAEAFKFEAPRGAELVKFFIPPHPAQLLAKPTPPFEFLGLDGKPVVPASLAGKIVVIDFWATWCEPCRLTLPELEKVYQKFKTNDKIAFLVVSVDEPQTPDKALREALDQLKVTIPVARDLKQQSYTLFKTANIPSLFIFGADGTGQYYKVGGEADLVTSLTDKLEKLLAGKTVFEESLQEYRQLLARYEQTVQLREKEAEVTAPSKPQRMPRAEIAKRSEPKHMRLQTLWKCTDVKSPGNILVVPRAGSTPQILVVDGWKAVAELGPDGKVLARHKPEIHAMGVFSFLRTAADRGGRRYFVACSSMQQQLYLFDDQWNLLLSYPKDAWENRHAGIGDVQIADLEGDGKLELAVGYWGVVGVQGVSLEGDRLWNNRSVSTVLRIELTGPDAQGARNLLCVNRLGTLAVLDAKGQSKGEIAVQDYLLHWVMAADLQRNGKVQYCGLSATDLGNYVGVGFDLTGKRLWIYELPAGTPPLPIEPIIAGNLSKSGPGQWLLPGPDGSIHVLGPDGKLVDRFNYGAALAGMATAELDGQPVLLIASPDGVEALRVSLP